jgi:outer membrane receptor for ferrienterochelin and colicin
MKRLFVVLLVLSGLGSNVICAEDREYLGDLTIEQLMNMEISVVSKKAEGVARAPGVVTVITADEIKAFGAKTLADVLERAPSIQMLGSHLFPRNVVSLRGDLMTHSDNHVLILLDGRPMREGVNGGISSPIYTVFPVEVIGHIEIIRGPGSVLYGSNAFAGVINIVTKKAYATPSLRLEAGGGSSGYGRGALLAGVNREKLSAVVSAQAFRSDGWSYQAMTDRPGFAERPIDMRYGEEKLGIFGTASFGKLSLSVFYSHGSDDVLGRLPYAAFESVNNIDRIFLDLGYEQPLSETWKVNLNITHNLIDAKLNDESSIANNWHQGSDWLGEVSVSGELADNLNLVIGTVADTRHKDHVPETSRIKETYHLVNLSAYAQLDYTPVERLKLVAGLQYNRPDDGDDDLVPRIGAVLSLTDNLDLKLLHGEAFRSPAPLEVMIEVPDTLYGNPDLSPETIATSDLQLLYRRGGTEASLTLFHSKYDSLITRVSRQQGRGQTFANSGELKTRGIELVAKHYFSEKLMMTGSASYQKAEDDATPSPKLMAKLGVSYDLGHRLQAAIFDTYFGEPQDNGAVALNPPAEAVHLLSLNLTYRLPFQQRMELGIYGQNLLDQDYYFPEFSKSWYNTLPISGGRAIYGTLAVTF